MHAAGPVLKPFFNNIYTSSQLAVFSFMLELDFAPLFNAIYSQYATLCGVRKFECFESWNIVLRTGALEVCRLRNRYNRRYPITGTFGQSKKKRGVKAKVKAELRLKF